MSFHLLLVRKKEVIDLQHPYFLQIAGSQWQCPFSLSLNCCGEEGQRSLHVCYQMADSVSMAWCKMVCQGARNVATHWQRVCGKVAEHELERCWQTDGLLSVLGADKEMLSRSRGVVTPLGMAESEPPRNSVQLWFHSLCSADKLEGIQAILQPVWYWRLV